MSAHDSTFPLLQEASGLLAQAASLLARLAAKRTTAPVHPPCLTVAEAAQLAPVLAAPAAPEYLTTAQAATRLGMSKKGLEQLRARGGGPPFVRVGKAVRYAASELASTRQP